MPPDQNQQPNPVTPDELLPKDGPARATKSQPAEPQEALPFARLGHYEIVSRIGRGGMGDVYTAYERALDRQVAIKVLPAELACNPDFIKRFKAEAAAAAKLVHPNIIKIHFIGEDGGRHFFVMQYVDGESLADRLARRIKLPVEETVKVVEQALAGLAAAHKAGMVHRDIKPGNLLLETRTGRALLADFGLAKLLGSSMESKTASGTILGTADYIAPEQGRGQTVDGRSDLYSVGVVLYRVLSGRLPFEADNASAMIFQHVHEPPPPLAKTAPHVPAPLASLVEKLLAKSPADRYQTAEEVLAQLASLRPRQPSVAKASPKTTIVRLPEYDEGQLLLPQEVSRLMTPGWWDRVQDKAASLFHRHAPEVIRDLQNTEQQFQGAVARYERRRRDLRKLAQDAAAVFAELKKQAAAQRAAALAAQKRAVAAANPKAASAARDEEETCARAAADLDRQIAEQKVQMEPIASRLAQVEARVLELRNQRDLLQARLHAAQAPKRRIPRARRRSNRGIKTAAIGGAVGLGVLVLIWWLWKGSQFVIQNLASQQAPPGEKVPDVPGAFSPSARPAGTDKALLHTAADAKPLFAAPVTTSEIIAVRYESDGQLVAAARADGTVEFLDAESGKRLNSIQTGASFAGGFVSSASRQVFAGVAANGSGASAGKLQIWNWRESGMGTTLSELSSTIRPLAISDKQGFVLALVSDGSSHALVRWDLETRDEIGRQTLPEGRLGVCAVRPGGDWVALVHNDAEIIVGRRPHDGSGMTFQSLATAGKTLAFHPVNRSLGVAGSDGTVTLWDLDRSQPAAVLRAPDATVRALAFDSTGRRLAVVTDKDVRVWDLGLDYVRCVCSVADVRDAAFRPDGARLVTCSRQSGVQVWNTDFMPLAVNFEQWLGGLTASYGKVEMEKSIQPRLPVAKAIDPRTAVTRDGRLVVRAPAGRQGDEITCLEDARTSERLHTFGGTRPKLCLALSPDERLVATGSYDDDAKMGEVIVWELRSGIERRRFNGHRHYARSVAFSPDSGRLLSGGEQTMHLWDVPSGAELRRFAVPFPFVKRASFSPDGRLGVASDTDLMQGIQHILFDLETGDQLLQFSGPYPEIAFTPRDILCDTRFGTLERTAVPAPRTAPTTLAATLPVVAQAERPAAGAAGPQPATVAHAPRPVAQAQTIQTLQIAIKEFDTHGKSERFEQLLQAVAPHLPEAQVTTGIDPLKWNSIVPYFPAVRLQAFRFKSPLKGPADLHWAFTLPTTFSLWYILPVRGTMSGFDPDSFQTEWNLDIPDAALAPGTGMVLQTLLGGRIRPGEEYIIWNVPYDNTAEEMKLALRLSTAGTLGSDQSAPAVARALGFELKHQVVDQSAEGVRAALLTAHTLVNLGYMHTDAILRVLEPVRSQLPEIKVSQGPGSPIWNHVTPDKTFRFHAVRFKSALSQPADAHLVVVAPDDLPAWRLAPVSTWELKDSDFQAQVNVSFPEANLHEENLAVFQSLPRRSIEPGREYILWFSPIKGALPDLDVALRLSPTGSIPETTSAQSMAAALGLSLPEKPCPERVRAAFRRCRTLLDLNQQMIPTFASLLEFTLPALAELNVGGDRAEWNHLDLDTSEIRFNAYRFQSRLDKPADLYAAFAKPPSPKSAWGFVSLNPHQSHVVARVQHEDAQFDGLELPEHNLCLFDRIVGGIFQPSATGILYFGPEKSDGLTVHVALRLTEAGRVAPPASPKAAAAILGLNLRASGVAPGSRVLEGHSDAASSVAFVADGADAGMLASGSADGTVRFWDPATGETRKTLECTDARVDNLRLSADGRRVAVIDADSRDVVVWDAKSSKPITTMPGNQGVVDFTLSEDGKWLAVAGTQVRSYLIMLKDLQSGKQKELVRSSDVSFLCIRWTPDGKTLIAAGGRSDPAAEPGRNVHGVIRFFDRDSGRMLREIKDDIGHWTGLALSADGRRLAAVKAACVLRVWDLPSGKEIASASHDAQNPHLAISANGKLIAMTRPDGTVSLWDGEALRLRRLLRGHAREVFSAAFAPDGESLASSGRDASVRLWDVKNPDPKLDAVERAEVLTNSVGMKLIPIPAGEYMMGMPEGFVLPQNYQPSVAPERPQHRVRISHPCYFGAHEVTVGQFRDFVDATGHRTTAEASRLGGHHIVQAPVGFVQKPEFTWRSPGFDQGDDHPVVQVSWDDAVAFCEWLSEKDGARYRLPTEAEWEYACRARSTTGWSFGDFAYYLKWCANTADRGLIKVYGAYGAANDWTDGFNFTAPVGSYLPNAFGLFDMHANVFEWCADWYHEKHYSASEVNDPKGPKSGTARVQRGTSFFYDGVESRSSNRSFMEPGEATSQTGFRVVREFDAGEQ